jgi:hypothetical protein
MILWLYLPYDYSENSFFDYGKHDNFKVTIFRLIDIENRLWWIGRRSNWLWKYTLKDGVLNG